MIHVQSFKAEVQSDMKAKDDVFKISDPLQTMMKAQEKRGNMAAFLSVHTIACLWNSLGVKSKDK